MSSTAAAAFPEGAGSLACTANGHLHGLAAPLHRGPPESPIHRELGPSETTAVMDGSRSASHRAADLFTGSLAFTEHRDRGLEEHDTWGPGVNDLFARSLGFPR